MNQYFDFEYGGGLASCSATSSDFGVSNGREFEWFNVLDQSKDIRLKELGIEEPKTFRNQLKKEIIRRATADAELLDAAKYFSPEIFA